MVETYVTTKTLREDASGALHRGVRPRDGVLVLIRTLDGEPPAPRDVERLQNEWEILRRLDGPHRLRPLELERQGGQLRLVLEGFDGELLSARPRRRLDPGRFLAVAAALTRAVADLHRQDLVHRDLRPDNILYQPKTNALALLGFDISSRVVNLPAVPTASGLIEGALAYMSPEQTGHTSRGVDHRSDLYSLGVIFYELLTGELPFQAADPLEWVHCHVARAPRSPAEVVSDLPGVLADITLRLLAKAPEERYQSARGLLADLERCREAWTTSAELPTFELGGADVSDRFLVSQKLYGREAEVDTLVRGFERLVETEKIALMLVSGYSGIGKSSLVQALREPVVRARGYFIAGKYDQYQRDIPYATLVKAFQELLHQILTESDERILVWKQELLAALGANGQLIVDLIPQLELIIGPQPPVPKLLPAEAKNRLHLVFRRFIDVFARRAHPLVVFLDDLQWLDPASLSFITYLLTSPDPQALLLIGAYRDNEVSPSHPLMSAIEEVRRSDVPLHELVLGPLSPAHLTQLLADTLRRSEDDCALLAELVHTKTAGNPFFAIQFLTSLHREGLFTYDAAAGHWRWDLAAIRRKEITDNVVDLMLAKLKRLSLEAQRALMLAACIGETLTSETLALVAGCSEEALHRVLREAIDEGLLWRVEGSYRLVHDRVQEAAYALLDPTRRASQHLEIGRLLLAETPPDRLDDEIFVIVGQLNQGAALMTSQEEKDRLAELNLIAGRRAKSATAYASALNYLVAGRTMFGPGVWATRHDLAFTLYIELAECKYLVGNFRRSEELLGIALEHAESLLERVRVQRLKQRLFQLSGRFHEAVEVAIAALRMFGLELPEVEDEIWAATDREIAAVPVHLGGRSVAELADVPLTDDEEVRALIGLLAEVMPFVYASRPVLWPLVTVKGVNLCLQRGHAAESPFVYSCYAMVLIGVRRDIPGAHAFSELAIALNERLPSPAVWRGKILFHHAAVINVWSNHFATNFALLDRAFQACLDAGDLVHAGYLTYNAVWLHIENGDPLEQVVELARRYEAFAQQTHNDIVHDVVRLEEHFALSALGKTASSTDLSTPTFDEAACVASIEAAGFGLGIAYYYILKQVCAYHAGAYDAALVWAERAAPKILHVASMVNEVTHHHYRALTAAALYESADPARRVLLRAQLDEPLQKLKLWAEHCPDNFASRYALLSAELARIERRDTEAMRHYEDAIRAARASGFRHAEATALELAARFYGARGLDRLAETALRDARDAYARWGAEGKVRQLERLVPRLVTTSPLSPTALFSARAEQLDLLSVVKASQTISRELAVPRLQEKLLVLVLEHAAAQRGWLLLAEGDQLVVHARARIEGNETRVELVAPAPTGPRTLPTTVLNYVRRSAEAVVLADAAADGRFAGDEYFAAERPRSVLALPLERQGHLVGVLYLENNLVAGAFSSNKLVVLQLLAAQAAVSLETARLYADLQQENAERRRVEEETRRLNRELEQRVHDRTAQLEAANKELEAFAYSVSHDLRAPLRHINGLVGMLGEELHGTLDAQAEGHMLNVKRAAKRMGALIDDLLSFSRMGRQGLAEQTVDLRRLVDEILVELEPDTHGREVRWQLGDLPQVTGDRSMLRLALVNLLTNAVKFTRGRSPAIIEVGSRREGPEVVVYVRDNGVGFDALYVHKLFGVFQRLHGEREFEGTGIGLANVRRIIQRHGGRTWAEGELDHGATVYFSLPEARVRPRA